jgi:hypothetical protein
MTVVLVKKFLNDFSHFIRIFQLSTQNTMLLYYMCLLVLLDTISGQLTLEELKSVSMVDTVISDG